MVSKQALRFINMNGKAVRHHTEVKVGDRVQVNAQAWCDPFMARPSVGDKGWSDALKASFNIIGEHDGMLTFEMTQTGVYDPICC